MEWSTGHAFNRFTHYGARGALLENLTVFFGPERIWLYDNFGFKPGLEGREQFDATFQLRGGWELNGHVERNFVNFQDSSFAGYTIGSAAGPAYLPAEDFSGFTGEVKVTTPTWRQLGASCPTGGGRRRSSRRAPPGRAGRWSGSVDLRPTTTIRITALATVFRLDPAGRQRVCPVDHSPAEAGVSAKPLAILPGDRRVPLGAAGRIAGSC